jgi:hypothetical protein
MMRTSLVALVAARYYQAPAPATVHVGAPAASAMPYMAPVSYGFEQTSAFPSAPIAVPVAMPSTSSSKGLALPLMAGAAVGATVAVLFGSGKRSAAKPAAKKPAAKAAAKKPVAKAAAKKPVAKAAAKKPVAKAAPTRAAPTRAKAGQTKGSDGSVWALEFGVSPISRGIQPQAVSRPKPPPVARRASDPTFNKTDGKGGFFPWIVNEKGSYSKPLVLSSIDFTSDQGDALIGWGAMQNSVKSLYNPRGRKGLFGGCVTPASTGKRAGGKLR